MGLSRIFTPALVRDVIIQVGHCCFFTYHDLGRCGNDKFSSLYIKCGARDIAAVESHSLMCPFPIQNLDINQIVYSCHCLICLIQNLDLDRYIA